jgi:hypothetical protein
MIILNFEQLAERTKELILSVDAIRLDIVYML